MDEAHVNQFLWYGYLVDSPECPLPQSCLSACTADQPTRRDTEALVTQGAKLWRSVMAETTPRRGRVIVPLSGGLDSRAILGGALEHRPARDLTTYTYGTPGSLDYEIGNLVAARCGTVHHAIDLTRCRYDEGLLARLAERTGRRVAFMHHALAYSIQEQLGDGGVYLVGFMGEALSGAHLGRRQSSGWDSAVARFAQRNRFARSVRLTPSSYRPEDALPRPPFAEQNHLSADDQLDFFVRQACYIKPLLLPEGYEYRTPFCHPDWAQFILCVGRRLRKGQRLYKRILAEAFPALSSLPTKNSFGLPLGASSARVLGRRIWHRTRRVLRRFAPGACGGPDTMANYIDFGAALRGGSDLKRIVLASLRSLQRRRLVPWIDVDGIWERHQRGAANHADALMLLSSLELNLRIGNSRT